MSVGAAHRFFSELKPTGAMDQVAGLILGEIRRRLGYLLGVGLEYLTLDRQSRTLSGGELERVDLTTAIGSSLVNTLYVLDEPSIGLHPRDSRRLVEILHRLRSNQNTIVVVEHDPEIIKETDYIIDLGPKAGEQGGQVVVAGSYDALLKNENSLTATYMKVFDGIRRLFAGVDLSRMRGYTPSTFSFNIEGGRCETCRGEGYEKVEMQFLSDVYTSCPECHGSRFREEILEVTYRGRNIRGILDLTVSEAIEFFKDTPEIKDGLYPLRAVGLEYVRLGQPLTTLSGGESQRLKLAAHMARAQKAGTLFIFDEPTTGLHFHDIERLLWAFHELIDQGHSIVVIEHNMEVVKCADHIIDLELESGDAGGSIIAVGTPEQMAQVESSHTGRYLPLYLRTDTASPFVP